MKDSTCIFCKIANGEIPSATLYEDEMLPGDSGSRAGVPKAIALILPKNHFAGVFRNWMKATSSKVLALAAKDWCSYEKELKV